ncbi:MAG TPA: aminopeptidase P family N-terminal domain-containing protein, partial [Acidimicrobiales bacterium]
MSSLTSMNTASRLPRLRGALDEAGCDALLVTNLTNVRYLTGFTGSAALLFVLPDETVFATDGRYETQSAEELAVASVEARIVVTPAAKQREVLAPLVAGVKRLGLEAAHISWARQRAFEAEWFREVELVATEGLIEELRRVKDAGELERMA